MELKERIINEATRMFQESGIKSVRMDDIASACGISKRTLYENFSDREDLIRHSLVYYHNLTQEAAGDRLAKAENAIDEFRILFWHSGNLRDFNARVMKDLVKFYPVIFNDFLEQYHCKVIDNNKSRFERGIKQGFFLDQIDTEFMARTMTSYLYGLKKDFEDYDFSRKADNKQSERPFQYAIMYFLRGISTEKGRDYIDREILGIEDDTLGKR